MSDYKNFLIGPWIAAIILSVSFLIVGVKIGAYAEANKNKQPELTQEKEAVKTTELPFGVIVFEDKSNGATCWTAGVGISCVPTQQLIKETK